MYTHGMNKLHSYYTHRSGSQVMNRSGRTHYVYNAINTLRSQYTHNQSYYTHNQSYYTHNQSYYTHNMYVTDRAVK